MCFLFRPAPKATRISARKLPFGQSAHCGKVSGKQGAARRSGRDMESWGWLRAEFERPQRRFKKSAAGQTQVREDLAVPRPPTNFLQAAAPRRWRRCHLQSA